jgi:hypothetical protein
MINARKTTEAGKTPAKITVSMIDQDLKNGIGKAEMAVKYGIKPWEVDRMFEHPFLKGRRPSKKKPLSFIFEDDMADEAITNPNQVTLEQAIDEAIETVTEVKDQMHETQEAILDMLSPTEYETPEETLLKAAVDTPEITGIPNGDTMSDTDDELEIPSFKDTMDLVQEQQEEELDMEEDDTFTI